MLNLQNKELLDKYLMTDHNNLMRALNQEPTQHPFHHPTPRNLHPALKAIIALILLAGFLAYRFLLPKHQVTCIVDVYQDLTQSWNRQFVEDVNESAYEGNSNQLTVTGKAMIGTGQVLMDLWIIILGLIWLFKVSNLRAFLSAGLFFLTRGLIFLNIEKFPFPAHMAWRSPGFFALTVPYDHTRDFFYSGHTGTLTVIFLFMIDLKLRDMAIFAFLSLLFMMNLLLITKVHYVVDIAGGLIYAAWFYRLTRRFVFYFDKLVSLPYVLIRWIYLNKCMQEAEDGDMGTRGDNPQDPIQNNEVLNKMPPSEAVALSPNVNKTSIPN